MEKISREIGNRSSCSGTEPAQPLKRFNRQIQVQTPWEKRRIQRKIRISHKGGSYHSTLAQSAATCSRLGRPTQLLIRNGRLQEERCKIAQRTAFSATAFHEVLPGPLRHRHTDAPRSRRLNPGSRPAITALRRVLREGAHTANRALPMMNQLSVMAIQRR